MRKTTPLTLHRQTLRVLQDSHLRRVVAGGPTGNGASSEPIASNAALSVCEDQERTADCISPHI